MVPEYFTFLQNLYVNKGITEVEVGVFFNGCFMNKELSRQKLSLGKVPMNFYMSKHTKLSDLTDVIVNDIPAQHINVIKQVSTVWVGKKCDEYDFCMFFENFLIKGEIKITTVGNHLSGESKNTFSSEMNTAIIGPTTIKERKMGFLFVTNGKMTENNAKSVVKPCGMFVNSKRWDSTFTDALWFFTYANDNDEEAEEEEEAEEAEDDERDEEEAESTSSMGRAKSFIQKPPKSVTTTTTAGKRHHDSDDDEHTEDEDQPKKKKHKKDEGPPYICPYCNKEYEKRYDFYEAHVKGHEQ